MVIGNFGLADAGDAQEAEFLKYQPVRRRAHERAAVRSLLEYVRDGEPVPCSAEHCSSATAIFEAKYTAYLRNERGLSERSVEIYVPIVRNFLAVWLSTPLAMLDAYLVRRFFLERSHNRSSACAKLLASAVRSFLRFLFLRGETTLDLSFAIPTVRRWGLAPVHDFLSPTEVEQVLSTADRQTPGGRRDYAILLLLSRLGLRAGEVTQVELRDIHWRTAEIVVRGKGRALDHLPLPSDVGEALAIYIQKDRGPSASQRVFLRQLAPRIGFTGPSAVSCVARTALIRAGLRSSHRGTAHLFRHSLATRMIRGGASLAEISEVLRHRSIGITEIYAKVAFESLREVARPWPGVEDER